MLYIVFINRQYQLVTIGALVRFYSYSKTFLVFHVEDSSADSVAAPFSSSSPGGFSAPVVSSPRIPQLPGAHPGWPTPTLEGTASSSIPDGKFGGQDFTLHGLYFRVLDFHNTDVRLI